MPDNAFYVYGVVRFGIDLAWQETGIDKKRVYMFTEGNFSALVHDCEAKPYSAEDPGQIREMIINHNRILDRAMEEFGGVIPLSFNTIIKKGTDSAFVNLRQWLSDDQEELEGIWNRVKGKKEYGLRIYYKKDKLFQEAYNQNETNLEEGPGLNYLLQVRAEAKAQEIFHERINKLKSEFFEGIKKMAREVVINHSQILLEEEKDLLLRLSVLIEEKEINEINEFLEKKTDNSLFQIAGPFAPYSFVETER